LLYTGNLEQDFNDRKFQIT